MGQPARQQLVDHDPERVHVRRRGGLLSARLLGRQVRGADHRPDLVRRVCSPARAIPKSVSLTVISRPGVAVYRRAPDHHQVPGLDVAVDDPLAVRELEPAQAWAPISTASSG